MSDIESLRRFGTIAFGSETMARNIRYGTPLFDPGGTIHWIGSSTEISLDVWLLTIPECYRTREFFARLRSALESGDFIGQKATEKMRFAVIARLQSACIEYATEKTEPKP